MLCKGLCVCPVGIVSLEIELLWRINAVQMYFLDLMVLFKTFASINFYSQMKMLK